MWLSGVQAHRRTGYDLFLADLLQIVVNGILGKRRNDGVVGPFRRAGKDLLCELHDGCAVLRRSERDGRDPGRLIAGIVGLLLEVLARSGVAVEGNDGAVCGALERLDLGNGCVARSSLVAIKTMLLSSGCADSQSRVRDAARTLSVRASRRTM